VLQHKGVFTGSWNAHVGRGSTNISEEVPPNDSIQLNIEQVNRGRDPFLGTINSEDGWLLLMQ
jgi:hypothetical protein